MSVDLTPGEIGVLPRSLRMGLVEDPSTGQWSTPVAKLMRLRLAKYNPYHKGKGPGGGQFTTSPAGPGSGLPSVSEARGMALDGEYLDGDPRNGNPKLAAEMARIDLLAQHLDDTGRSTLDMYDGPRRKWHFTMDRYLQQQQIVNEILAEAKAKGVVKGHSAVMLGGMTGSGKTKYIKDSGFGDYLHIDADDIKYRMFKKGMVPSYKGLSTLESTSLYHAESSIVLDRLMRAVNRRGYNLVYDTTFHPNSDSGGPTGNTQTLQRLATLMHGGYKVSMGYIKVPYRVALQSTVRRWKDGGRYVPMDVPMGQIGLNPDKPLTEQVFDYLKSIADESFTVTRDGHGGFTTVAKLFNPFPQRPIRKGEGQALMAEIQKYHRGEITFDELDQYVAAYPFRKPKLPGNLDWNAWAAGPDTMQDGTWGEVVGAWVDELLTDKEFERLMETYDRQSVVKRLAMRRRLTKYNQHHKGQGPGGGQFATGDGGAGSAPDTAAVREKRRIITSKDDEDGTQLLGMLRKNGGFTLDAATEQAYGEGYSVATKPRASYHALLSKTTPHDIERFLDREAVNLSRPGAALGGWLDTANHKVWLDVVTVYGPQQRAQAAKAARDHNQIAMFDLGSGSEIATGGTGLTKADSPVLFHVWPKGATAEDIYKALRKMDMRATLTKFNPNHEPAGSPKGGEFAHGHGGPGGAGPMPTISDFAGMERIKGPLGSQGGQWYRDLMGREFLVKRAKSGKHAFNEIASGEVYRVLGVPFPRTKVLFQKGKFFTVSEKIQGLTNKDAHWWARHPEVQAEAAQHFGVDAILSHWDVAGLTADNTLVDSNRVPHRIESGGAMQFRGMGEYKPSFAPGKEWTEPSSMRTSNQGKQLYGRMTDSEAARSLQQVHDRLNLADINTRWKELGIPSKWRHQWLDTLQYRYDQIPGIVERLTRG